MFLEAAQKVAKIPKTCPRHNATHSNSSSGTAIATDCACCRLNAGLLHRCARSNVFTWYLLISQMLLFKRDNRSIQPEKLSSYYHEMRSINQTHRASVIARVIKYTALWL